MNDFSEILQTLSEAPDSQIDVSICNELKAMACCQDYDPTLMLAVIDKCVNASLASDFAIQAMHFVFENMCKQKGINSLDMLTKRLGKNDKLWMGF